MGTQSITLAAASDLHYLFSGLYDDGEAFRLMTRFSDGAVTVYGDEIFEAFLSEMRQLHPDAVLVTGDLTFNGEKKSHEHLAAGFESLWNEGIPVLVIPGNHDLANPLAGSYLGSKAKPADSVSKEEFCRIYAPPSSFTGRFFLTDASSLSYVFALSDDLWLMCSDVNGNGLPGCLTEGVLSWAGTVLETARSKNARVISVTHQNLLAHNSLFAAGFVMEDAVRLLNLYREYGVRLNLSGHMHIQHVKRENGICEIVTSALMIPPCQYGILNIKGDIAAYRSKIIDVALWALKSGSTDDNLLHFADFASAFYQDVQVRTLEAELADVNIPAAIKSRLSASMGIINQAFFAGSMADLKDRDSLRSEWQEALPGNFRNDYIDSVFKEGIKDERNAVVCLR